MHGMRRLFARTLHAWGARSDLHALRVRQRFVRCAGNMGMRVFSLCMCADVAGLQREDGSFSGDEWGEVDTR